MIERGIAGGLMGYVSESSVKNCYFAGNIDADNGRPLFDGGGTISDLYFDADRIPELANYNYQMGRTSEQMMQRATFYGFDFKNTWELFEGGTYPYLKSLPAPFVTPLPPAGGLRTTAVSANYMEIAWDTVNQAQWYEIELDGSSYKTVIGLTVRVEGLTNNREYTIRVRGANDETTGIWAVLTVKTEEILLPGPANLRVTNRMHDSITLAWDSIPEATVYLVYKDGAYITETTELQYTVTGLEPSVTYAFEVRAKNAEYNGLASETLSEVTKRYPLTAPTGLHSTDKYYDQPELRCRTQCRKI